jgi:hypothetical protein
MTDHVWTRVSKNGVFGPNSLPGFWTRQYPLIMPILTGFGANWRGPKNGQGELADLDALGPTYRYVRPLTAQENAGKPRLDNGVRGIRHALAVGNRQGVKPVDNVRTLRAMKRMIRLPLVTYADARNLCKRRQQE